MGVLREARIAKETETLERLHAHLFVVEDDESSTAQWQGFVEGRGTPRGLD